MKTPTKARIVQHGVEGSQFFQGHGISFTPYTDCATGIGYTETEAYEDALDGIASSGAWDVDVLEALLAPDAKGLDPETSAHGNCPDVDTDMHESCEMWWHVSIDVAGVDVEAFSTEESFSRGFDKGNYGNAYESQDWEAWYADNCIQPTGMEERAYREGLILGFFFSYEIYEILDEEAADTVEDLRSKRGEE